MKLTKLRILVATIATILLTMSAPLALADKPHKMTSAQMAAMCKTMDPAECRVMMREMLKNPALHKTITEEIRANPEFQKYYNSHPSGG